MNQRLWFTGLASAALASLLTIAVIRGCNDNRPSPAPDPVPTPIDVVPIKEAGFRVIVVYESADGVPEQINGADVRGYLNNKCVKGPDAKTPDFRIWDQDVDLTNASRYFVEAMLRPRTSLPWILISDGKRGFEGPLRGNSQDVLNLLKKYGGQ